MNKVILIGRLTKDPELRTTQSGVSVCQFTLAVDRRYASKTEGQPTADFIPCVAWRNSAEFISKYFQKGSKAVITGSIQTRTYTDSSNNKRYATEVIVDEVEFGESKKNSSPSVSFDDMPVPPETSGNASVSHGEYFALDDGNGDLPF